MTALGIFGASGFAREVADIALELGRDVVYIARDEAERDHWTFPDEVIVESELDGRDDLEFAIGIGENGVRERIATRYRDRLRFPTLIHPSATFGRAQRQAIEARSGVIVCAGVRFTNSIEVGDFSIFNLNATIGHDVVIEDFVNLAPGAHISGNVHLATRVMIGTGAAVNQGTAETKLTIGAGTAIGSGAVVVKDCDPDAVYVGIPARRIK
jgi:sugar O-acyltransferase (sialic acid O-acetyltransferase NeuD family)